MKKTFLPITALMLSTLASIGQGTLNYSTRVTGIVVAPIYRGTLNEPGKTGNTTAGMPPGTQTYLGTLLTGSGFSAQLFYAAGLDQPEGSLIAAAASITTFRTSATFAGSIAPSILTLPGTTVGGDATLQLRVWDNLGGTLSSWAAAEPYWLSGVMLATKSALFNITGLADVSAPNPPDMTGFRSFNIVSEIPEPGTYALLALGGLGFWFCRGKK